MRTNVDSGVRTAALRLLVRLGLLPADLLLLYSDTAFEWKSGFGGYAHFVYGLCRATLPELVVEIGSAYGKSTCFIAAALKRNGVGTLVSIDPHQPTAWNDGRPTDDTFEIVRERLRQLRLSCHVVIERDFSQKVARSWTHGHINLLLIDGSHGVDDVHSDFELFRPHLAEDSLVLFHDTMWEHRRESPWYRSEVGVPIVVQRLLDDGYPGVTLTTGWGLTILHGRKGGVPLLPFGVARVLAGATGPPKS